MKKQESSYVDKDIKKVFVYGTLKVGGRFADKLAYYRTSSVIAYIDGTMYDTGHNYPMVRLKTGYIVTGELHTFREFRYALSMMDHIEGYPYNYNRTLVEVNEYAGEAYYAWVYHGDKEQTNDLQIIESGTWPDKSPF